MTPAAHSAGVVDGLPPGPRLPIPLQMLAMRTRQRPYLERARRRYGPIFTVRLFGLGNLVIVSDVDLIKQTFRADPAILHAGTGSPLRPLLGPHSLLGIDEDEHMEQRKLLLPPFKGQRMQRYESMIALKLYRTLHELERLQRLRQGERLPAPAAVDVTVHTDPRELDSFAECADKALEGSLSEPRDKRENINSKTAPAESEAATSLDLNVEADARGLPSFLQPSEKESLGGSESKLPDRGEDLNSQVVPENGEATETATEDE